MSLAAGVALCGCIPATVGPPVEANLSQTDAASAELIRELIGRAKEKPRDAASRAALGMAYEVGGLMHAALRCYEQAVELEPTEPRWDYYLAHALARIGDLEAALDALDRVVGLDDGYAPAHVNRGQWLLELDRVDEASEAFERVLELERNHPGGWMGKARVHLKRGEGAAAAEILEQLLRGRRHPFLYQLLGSAYRQAGDPERARSALARAKPGEPPPIWPDPWQEEKAGYRRGLAAAIKQAEGLLGRGRYDEAIELLEPLLGEEPTNKELLTGLSLAYRGSGRSERALELLRAALTAHPRDYALHLRISEAYQERGERDRAMYHVERAIEIQPARAAAWARRGSYLRQAGLHSEALAAFEEALRRDAQDARWFFEAGALEASLGDWARAAGRFERAVSLDPLLAAAWVGLGGSRAELGELDGAEQALERAARLRPDSPQLLAARRRLAELRAGGR